MPPQYKFVEVSPVTDETLEAAVNEWVAKGWYLEGIRFVMTEHSKRPQLAFVSFVTSLDVTTVTASSPVSQPAEAQRQLEEPPERKPRVITAVHRDDVE
jgi:hypothetical protein